MTADLPITAPEQRRQKSSVPTPHDSWQSCYKYTLKGKMAPSINRARKVDIHV